MTRAYPSINQERVAKVVAEKLNKRELIEGKNVLGLVGYSEAIQKNPKVVFKSKGFKEALKRLGFSIEAADMTVAKILRVGKEENQLKASDQIYKRLGAYGQPDSDKGPTIANFTQIIINAPDGRTRKQIRNIPDAEAVPSVASADQSSNS